MAMASKFPSQLLSTFLLILLNFVPPTKQDEPCPYPCYPPPTGTGSATPITTSTPPPPATLPPPSTSSIYPPPQGYNNYPPQGYNNYPTPPSGNNYGNAPPDPIWPYFPYYYRGPPHQTYDGSFSAAAASLGRASSSSTTLILISFLFLLLPLV